MNSARLARASWQHVVAVAKIAIVASCCTAISCGTRDGNADSAQTVKPTGTGNGADAALSPNDATSTAADGSPPPDGAASGGSSSTAEPEAPLPGPLEVVRLFSSDCSGNVSRTTRMFEVIRDEPSLRAALMESAWYFVPDPETMPLPDVDFSNYVVIAVHAGPRGCGPTIEVTAARYTGMEVEIEVTDRFTCTEDASDSWPYMFARVLRIDRPYVFIEMEPVKEPCDAGV
jgi:hypothetical protein